jgi:ATP-dependent Lon protease
MELPLMAIRETVVFPGTMTPFVVGRAASLQALNAALGGDKKMFLVAQRDASVDEPTPDELYRVGTIVNIVQSLKLPDGNIKMLAEGVDRAELVSVSHEDGLLRATVRVPTYEMEWSPRVAALASRVAKRGRPHAGQERVAWDVVRREDVGRLADLMSSQRLEFAERQELLEIFDPVQRLRRVEEMWGPAEVEVSAAVLTRWAESCAMMDRLGRLLRQESEGRNRRERVRDLANRAQRLARHLSDELAVYGAVKP